MEADFSGYATKNGLLCADGRTIVAGAFKDNDRQRVPLVWQHQHDAVTNVLGHGILEDRADGTYIYGFFNDSPEGQHAKEMVKHGDINALSIFANKLIHQGKNVVHGAIREVSLVLAGANPGAMIENVSLAHSENGQTIVDEAVIWEDLGISLAHADLTVPEPEAKSSKADEEEEDGDEEEDLTNEEVLHSLDESQSETFYSLIEEALAHSSGVELEDLDTEDEIDAEEFIESLTDQQQDVVYDLLDKALNSNPDEVSLGHADTQKADTNMADKTVKEVYDSLDADQQKVVDFLIGAAIDDSTAAHDGLDEGDTLSHSQEGTNVNVFDQSNNKAGAQGTTLSHDQIKTIVNDGIEFGSFKKGFLAHAAEYGINNIDLMFPDAKAVGDNPELIARQAEWVPKVLDATKKVPYARIKSLTADLTADEARAKGYIKGKMKKEEVIELLKRTTGPTTIYKKQKLDRDDIIDITDFDVIAWLKWEIRFMLNEELARAILIGDGRSNSDEDKIKDPKGAVDGIGIRSIANDNEMYAHKLQLASNVANDVIIDEVTMARTYYRGSGSPTFYTTDKVLTGLLLLKDKMNRRLYDTEAALASALRVKEIVAVEVLEETPDLVGIIVNLVDYSVGSNAGGQLSFFEDFDIDFNQNKYLLETRVSGALTKPKSAIVIRREIGTEVVPTAPNFNGTTNTISIPTKAGVTYLVDGEAETGNVVITKDAEVEAVANDDFYIDPTTTHVWSYGYTAPSGS